MDRGEWFDEAWARFTRVVMFVAGLAILVWETVSTSTDRPWLYAAAIGLMGVPLARQAEGLLGKFSGQGPQEEPPKPKPRPPRPRKGSTRR